MRHLLLFACAASLFGADEIPQWAREAASMTVPPFPAKVDAVVLLQEEHLSIEPDGKRVMRDRGAIRCVAKSGRCQASAVRSYNARTGKIRDFRAWMLPSSGKEIRYGKDRIADANYSDDSVETRTRHLDTGDDFRPGSTFAWEIVEEEKSVFTQVLHPFQSDEPVMISRFIASLPPGWEVRSQVFNRSSVEPAVSGNTHTWELRDLPWMEREIHSPGFHALVPRLALTFYPTGDNTALRTMKDWASVSAWLAELSDAQSAVTPAIQTKASQLVAGATDELAKIRAIAAFAQQTKYVSIQMNLTRGGGYTPHKADEVLTKNYGDCKDKANLMRALLKAAGIESYLTAIYSGSREYVRSEWPATSQFNHMIIAVRVPASVSLPTVTDHPKLGRLLIFDPTDPNTPVGDLDEDQQGSYALVVAGQDGALLKMPLLPASANRVETETNAEITPSGGMSAQALSRFHGQSASRLRGAVMREAPDELRRSFETILTRQLGSVRLKNIEHKNATGQFDLTLAFEAARFGQIMQDRLLIVNPGSLAGSGGYTFPAVERKLPVRLSAEVRSDKVALRVPEGFAIDELPDPVKFTGPYGNYSAQWKFSAGQVEFQQSLELHDVTAPASDYAKVRSFFENVGRASTAPVVLVRK
ncbi:MAG: transglutaminase domain-containing protein [Bryobacterales bacterium]|nr:transglutaminase domain-containing protein [Bryobacterales bacterium]